MKNNNTPAERVINAFGGSVVVAEAINLSWPTVSNWKTRGGGLIPSAHHNAILKAAKIRGVKLKAADLVDTAGI